jgi:hypothetical protein
MKIALYIFVGLTVVGAGLAIYYKMCEMKAKKEIEDLKAENAKLKATQVKPLTTTSTVGMNAANALQTATAPVTTTNVTPTKLG